jgi:hypothetical protein
MESFRLFRSLWTGHRQMQEPVGLPVAEVGQSIESMAILQKTTGGRRVDSWQPQAPESVAERLISVNPLFLDRNHYFSERIYAATG